MPSPNAPRLYLDEHLSPRIAKQLIGYGFDVTTVREANMLSRSDKDQIELAIAQERALVTFNFRDFVDLHEEVLSQNRTHFGLIFSTEERIGILLNRLLRLMNSMSADDLKNQIFWLNAFR